MDLLPQYEQLGLDLVMIDDQETLFFNLLDGEMYATITDEDGRIPSADDTPIILSIYDDNDAFQWSVSLPSTSELIQIITRVDDSKELLQTLEEIRSENIAFYDAQQKEL